MPALCMHRHAWPLVSLRHLAGLHWDAQGVRLRPAFPRQLGEYSLRMGDLASIVFDGNSKFTGHYTPTIPSTFRLSVDLSLVVDAEHLNASVVVVEVWADGCDHTRVQRLGVVAASTASEVVAETFTFSVSLAILGEPLPRSAIQDE